MHMISASENCCPEIIGNRRINMFTDFELGTQQVKALVL